MIQNGGAAVLEGAFEALATNNLAEAPEILHAELRDQNSLYKLQALELLTCSAYTNFSEKLLPILQEVQKDQDPLVRDYANKILTEKKLEAEGGPGLSDR